jgi:hypothetical protein
MTLLVLVGLLAGFADAEAQGDPPLNACMINRDYECMGSQSGKPDSDRGGQSESDYCTQLAIDECS